MMSRIIITVCAYFLATSTWAFGQNESPKPLTESERAKLVDEIERHRRDANKHIEAERLPDAVKSLQQVLALRRKLWNTKEHARGHRELILSLSDVGQLFQQLGRPAEALPYTEEAAAMAQRLYPKKEFPQGHRDLVGTLNELAQLYQALGQFEKALSPAQTAVAGLRLLFPAMEFPDGHPDLALVICNCANVFEDLGRHEEAKRHYEEAVAMCRRLDARQQFPGTQRVLGVCLGNLANTLGTMGLNEQALPCYEESLALCRRVYAAKAHPRGHTDLAFAFNNLGLAHAAVGNAERALTCFEESLAMCRRLYPESEFPEGHPHLALALHNLGHGLGELRQHDRALDYLQQGLAMRRRVYPKKEFPNGHPNLAASIFSIVGTLRVLDRPKDALPLCEEVLAMCRKLYPRDKYPGGSTDLIVALQNYGHTLTMVGRAREGLSFAEEALSYYRRLFPKEQFPAGHRAVANQLHALGIANAALREPKEALPYFRDSLEMYNGLIGQEALFAPEADALELTRGVTMARDDFLSIALEVPDAANSVYGYVWDSKAALTRILERRLVATRIALADAKEGPLRTKWEELTAIRRRIGQLQQATDVEPARRDALLVEWFDQADRFERELIRLLPVLGRERAARRRTADDLLSTLPPRTAFVDFLRYERFAQEKNRKDQSVYRTRWAYVAFVAVPGKGVTRVELNDAKAIDDEIKKWREAIADRGDESAHARKLFELVWTPVARQLPAETETVWLAPDGDLARLPFAALPGTARGTILLEDLALCMVPHGPFLLEQLLSKSAGTGVADAKLIVGGVRYDPIVGIAKGRWPHLQGTAIEAEHLRKLAEGKAPIVTLAGGEATALRLAGELPKARYAHLATHGYFDEEGLIAEERRQRDYFEQLREYEFREGHTTARAGGAGKRSPLGYVGLVLADANEPVAASRPTGCLVGGPAIAQTPSAILSGDRIAELPLQNLKLCVLSACETGLGTLTGGEGVQGLQRAFHLAGCQNVVCSLWSVNDEATAALMRRFYYHLWEKKEEPLQALRFAQLELYRNPGQVSDLLRGNAPKFSGSTKPLPKSEAPKDRGHTASKLWAAFVLSGLGR